MNIEKVTYFTVKSAIKKYGSISPYIDQLVKSKDVYTRDTIGSFGEGNAVQKRIIDNLKDDIPGIDIEVIFPGSHSNTYWFFTPELKAYSGTITASDKVFALKQSGDENIDLFARMANREILKEAEKSEDFVINRDIEIRERKREMKNQKRAEEVPELTGEFDEDLKILMSWSRCFREFSDVIEGNMLNTSNRALHRIGRATYALDNDPIGRRCEEVTIYRAMPVDGLIEAGDWVSDSFEYAEGHLSNTDGESFVESEDVPQSEVYLATDGNEYLYIPEGTWNNFESLEELWKATCPKKRMEYPKVKPRKYANIMKEKSGNADMTP